MCVSALFACVVVATARAFLVIPDHTKSFPPALPNDFDCGIVVTTVGLFDAITVIRYYFYNHAVTTGFRSRRNYWTDEPKKSLDRGRDQEYLSSIPPAIQSMCTRVAREQENQLWFYGLGSMPLCDYRHHTN